MRCSELRDPIAHLERTSNVDYRHMKRCAQSSAFGFVGFASGKCTPLLMCASSVPASRFMHAQRIQSKVSEVDSRGAPRFAL